MSATATTALREIPITLIDPSKTNPRTHFEDAYLEELAGSIRDKGLMQPIVVRPKGDRFEIVAGECRYRGTTRAGLESISAIVREYSDEQVLELQLIENIHRRDLTPLEQAKGYRLLIDSNPTKHTAEAIATKIGMSPQWVWDRLSLNGLIPAAKLLLEQERISIGHAILIARQSKERQEEIVDPSSEALWAEENSLELDEAATGEADPYADLKPVSIRELERWIAEHVRFDIAHAAVAQPFDFGETADTITAAASLAGRGRKVVAITHDYRVGDAARDEKEKTYGSEAWERADGKEGSKPCEYAVLGVVKAGQGRGHVFQVCVSRDRCKVHFAAEVKAREQRERERASRNAAPAAAKSKTKATPAESSWQRAERLRKEARQKWAAVWPHVKPHLVKHFAGAKLTRAFLENVLEVGELYGPQLFKDVEKTFGIKVTDKNLAQALALGGFVGRGDEYATRDQFVRDAKLFKFDLTPIEKRQAAEQKKAATKDPEPGGKKRTVKSVAKRLGGKAVA